MKRHAPRLNPQATLVALSLLCSACSGAGSPALRAGNGAADQIERQLGVSIDGELVASAPEAAHAAALTRETVTPAVHYVRFGFTEAQVTAFAGAEEVALVATHPAYEVRTGLSPAERRELLGDLLGTTKPLSIG